MQMVDLRHLLINKSDELHRLHSCPDGRMGSPYHFQDDIAFLPWLIDKFERMPSRHVCKKNEGGNVTNR